MKKKALCLIVGLLYVLLLCTLLSRKIEVEMMPQVFVRTMGKNITRSVELPVESLLYDDQKACHLFEIRKGEGWKSGLRAAEVYPSRYTAVLDELGSALVLYDPDYFSHQIVISATRLLREGELVEVLDPEVLSEDTWLVVCPQGIPAVVELPKNMELLEQSDTALRLKVKDEPPFMGAAVSLRMSMDLETECRVFSMTELQRIEDAVPYLVLLVVLQAAALILWIHMLRRSGDPRRWRRAAGICTVALVVLLLCGAWLLGRFDLPASMLPGENIFDMAYYREELAVIRAALEGLPL